MLGVRRPAIVRRVRVSVRVSHASDSNTSFAATPTPATLPRLTVVPTTPAATSDTTQPNPCIIIIIFIIVNIIMFIAVTISVWAAHACSAGSEVATRLWAPRDGAGGQRPRLELLLLLRLLLLPLSLLLLPRPRLLAQRIQPLVHRPHAQRHR